LANVFAEGQIFADRILQWGKTLVFTMTVGL